MWIDQRGSEVLTRNECLRLLAVQAGGIGRLGHVHDSQVVIQPVNYRMFDGDVLIQIGPGSILEAARHQTIVSFEIDQVDDPPGTAWSVLVHGLARVVDTDTDTERAHPTEALPLIPEPGTSLVSIRTGVVSGRRFPLRTAAPNAAFASAGTTPGAAKIELGTPAPAPPTPVSAASSVRNVADAMRARLRRLRCSTGGLGHQNRSRRRLSDQLRHRHPDR